MIDSSLFGVDLPAGTYAVGDVVQLGIIDGPAVVRSGRGAAILKRMTAGTLINASGSSTVWKVYAKNSDWVDPMMSVTASIRETTALDERSGCVQSGNNCPLTQNSSWQVWAECVAGGTTTVANSIFCLIDIDYPSVSSIIDPYTLTGIPATLELDNTIGIHASGTLATGAWARQNVDIFKAGYEYALQKLEFITAAPSQGFVSISNAAGMGGLKRIMPVASNVVNIRDKIEYASKLVKGPMDVSVIMFSNTGTAVTGASIDVVMDFVKRRVA